MNTDTSTSTTRRGHGGYGMIWRKRASAVVLTLAGVAALTGARHITPTVVLKKQADMIKEAVPGAAQFFLKTVKIGQEDYQRIHDQGNFEPDEDQVRFYYGKDTSGNVDGVVLFAQDNTQHGPLEVGIAFGSDGSVRQAVVTKATVETKPWVQTAIKSGLMKRFQGMRPGDDPATALQGLSKASLGEMPYYMAGVTVAAVKRGLVLYGVLYKTGI
jgi:hypothetical protein